MSMISHLLYVDAYSQSAIVFAKEIKKLTLLAGHQEDHPACKIE